MEVVRVEAQLLCRLEGRQAYRKDLNANLHTEEQTPES
jgi:hypothetical protein